MPPTVLPDCIYQGQDVPDIVRRYIAALEESSPKNPRTLLHTSALKYYQRFLTDESLIQEFTQEVESLDSHLTASHPSLEYTIQGRLKAFVSTENKIIKFLDIGRSIDSLRDVIAYRVVVDSNDCTPEQLVMECYSIANSLIEFYSSLGYILCDADPVEDTIDLSSPRLKEIIIPQTSGIDPVFAFGAKDYIRTPKRNGYQSIHLIFRMPDGLTFEVQIRTKRMDVYASEGYAEHGIYKESEYTNRLNFDPWSINIPGYEVGYEIHESNEPRMIVKDSSGFEYSKQIFFFEKSQKSL